MTETNVPFKEILKNVLSSSSEKLKNSIFTNFKHHKCKFY